LPYKIKKKKPLPALEAVFFCFVRDYSSEGAPTGQTPAQAPQLTQTSALISNLPSPSEIAPTGHSAAQAPQLMQASEITYAILFSPLYKVTKHVSFDLTNTTANIAD
jgi:hypothetical protein